MKYALTVIVLQYGKSEETLRCLEALSRSAGVDARCVVVDNASRQEDRDRLRDCGFAFEFLQNEENLGFAGGNNVVLRRLLEGWRENGHARYGLLLNNDVQVEPDTLREMMRIMVDKKAGAVGAINVDPGTGRMASSGGFVRWPSGKYRDVDLAALPARSDAVEVETLCGSTLLLDLRVLDRVGLFDPDYFCVYEETDLCLRIREAGFDCWLSTRARVSHAVGASTGRKLHFYFRFRNRVRFVRRRRGVGGLVCFVPGYVLEVAWRTLGYTLTLRLSEAAGVLRGAWDGARGVAGKGPFLP